MNACFKSKEKECVSMQRSARHEGAMSPKKSRFRALTVVCICLVASTNPGRLLAQQPDLTQQSQATPGKRVLMDAHNCYPYFEWWGDRIKRALSAGAPLAIEQDLLWYTDPRTGRSWSVVTHGAPATGHEPTLENYFFDNVRPVCRTGPQGRKRWKLAADHS